MFSKIWTKTSIPDFSAQIERLKTAIAEADAVVIGAGAGLSTAAGFTYSGERFERYFSDFAAKYGIRDMYSGGFFLFPTSEEFWAYWSRYIFVNRYMDAPKPVYNDLLKLVANKDYFVITTNVDHCFQKAGFDTLCRPRPLHAAQSSPTGTAKRKRAIAGATSASSGAIFRRSGSVHFRKWRTRSW